MHGEQHALLPYHHAQWHKATKQPVQSHSQTFLTHAPELRRAAGGHRARRPCARPRPAAQPPGARRCAAQAAGTAQPLRCPPAPPAGSHLPATDGPRNVMNYDATRAWQSRSLAPSVRSASGCCSAAAALPFSDSLPTCSCLQQMCSRGVSASCTPCCGATALDRKRMQSAHGIIDTQHDQCLPAEASMHPTSTSACSEQYEQPMCA